MHESGQTLAPVLATPLTVIGGLLLFGLLAVGIAVDLALLRHLRRTRADSPRQAEQLCSRPWRARELGVLLFVQLSLLLLALSGVDALSRLGGLADKKLLFYATLAQTLGMHAAAFAMIASMIRTGRRSWRAAFGLEFRDAGRSLRQSLYLYLGLLPLVGFYTLIYVTFLQRIGYPLDTQDVLRMLSDPDLPLWPQVTLGFMALVSAPVVEELLFRGIALPVAARHLGVMPAVYLVSFVFAAAHAHPPSFMTLFVLAVGLSLAYLHSGSILLPTLIHAVFNTVSLTAYLIVTHLPKAG